MSEPRVPILSRLGAGITAIDTGMVGERAFNAIYLIGGSEPTLVEAGPGADLPVVLAALEALGVDAEGLAHIVVTHVHVDHAGGAGALIRHFPHATLWVHERGARHMVDPSRLLASTARTYGPERMEAFFGRTEPVPGDRLRSMVDGSRIDLGDRALRVIHTPGHASHHVALHDTESGAVFTGEAIGSYLPWGPAFRPALPPPEVDVEQALASIDRIAALAPTQLLTSHFGPVPDGVDGCGMARDAIRSWSTLIRRQLEIDPDAPQQRLTDALAALAEDTFAEQAGRPLGDERSRYDVIGSIEMNAIGLARYWKKRWANEPPAS